MLRFPRQSAPPFLCSPFRQNAQSGAEYHSWKRSRISFLTVLHGADQQPTSLLQLVCAANGTFDASSVHCARPANASCEGGPISGTKHTGCDACTVSFTPCDRVLSNQQCFPQWDCAEGYTAPKGPFTPQCDVVTNQYNASTTSNQSCSPNECEKALNADKNAEGYPQCVSRTYPPPCH